MAIYQPPYRITPAILQQVADIERLLQDWSRKAQYAAPLLRRENRIRTIQASLAIEQNTLTTVQVTAIVQGEIVSAPARDILEVRNALRVYDRLYDLYSGSQEHLLLAHGLLMAGLTEDPGRWRGGNVGVWRERQLVHMAPPASQLPRLMNDLFSWLQRSTLHPLIASAVFHFEFEYIHPFSDGNGRMGRLWQTLILSEWRPELGWLPVETLIQARQQDYYRLLGECGRSADCTAFISFMLQMISLALQEALQGRLSAIRRQPSQVTAETTSTV